MTGQTKRDIVLEIIRDIARPKSPIDESTRIYEDLQIAGEDAREMTDGIHKECGTSFREFDFREYFPNEAQSIFYQLHLAAIEARLDPVAVMLDLVHLISACRGARRPVRSRRHRTDCASTRIVRCARKERRNAPRGRRPITAT